MFKAKLIPEDHCKACRSRSICIHKNRNIRVDCTNYKTHFIRSNDDILNVIMRRSLYEAVEGNQDEEP